MLVTIYEKKHNRFVAIKQYYQWRVPYSDEKIPCPGCGRELTYANLNYNHNCDGRLTDRPIARDRFRRNQHWRPGARFDPVDPI